MKTASALAAKHYRSAAFPSSASFRAPAASPLFSAIPPAVPRRNSERGRFCLFLCAFGRSQRSVRRANREERIDLPSLFRPLGTSRSADGEPRRFDRPCCQGFCFRPAALPGRNNAYMTKQTCCFAIYALALYRTFQKSRICGSPRGIKRRKRSVSQKMASTRRLAYSDCGFRMTSSGRPFSTILPSYRTMT